MERITNPEEARRWTDHIPLQWKYTAGVAGERFLQLLRQGKLQASECKKCNKLYLPPKIFCMDCFTQLDDWKDVTDEGAYLYSYTIVSGRVAEGEREILALVKFDGIEGGLLGRLKRKTSSSMDPRIGAKVKLVFRPKSERTGDLSDIAYFDLV